MAYRVIYYLNITFLILVISNLYFNNQYRNNLGSIKDQNKLEIGLKKIQEIKKRSSNADVRVTDNNQQDLVNKLNLVASIISAECTLKSAC